MGEMKLLIELANLTLDELELIWKWRNQQHIRDTMLSNKPISWDEHLNWFNHLKTCKTKLTKIFKVNKEPIGILNISINDGSYGICEWGFYLGKSGTAKGTGKILGYAALEFIFNTLECNYVIGRVINTNAISKNFHERLGFKLQHVLDSQFRDGQALDIFVYRISREEWSKQKIFIKNQINAIIERTE